MALISTRIPEDIEKELKWYAEKEKLGMTIALRRVLDKGLKEIKLEHALDLYQKGKVTLMKAGAIKINTKKIFDPNYVLKVNDIVKIGKRIIFKVK